VSDTHRLRNSATATLGWYRKPGVGAVGNDFHIAAHLTPPPIFRALFQVPYPASPLLAALTKTPGCGGIFPILEPIPPYLLTSSLPLILSGGTHLGVN